MKEIIYLDSGILHSYIAQYNDGLPSSSSREQLQEIKDAIEKEEGYHSRSQIKAVFKTGKFEIPLIFSTPEGQIEGIFQPGNIAKEKAIMSQTESGKEIISKQLHDNALKEFEDYLIKQDLIQNYTEENIEGKFIKITKPFKIIDFEYLAKIIQTEKLIKFMFKQAEEEIKKVKIEVETTKDAQIKTRQRVLIKQLESKSKSEQAKLRQDFNFIEESLEYLKDILPTNSFIKMEHIIAPLKEEHLREKAKELMFKYGGENEVVKATLIAKVTSRVTDVDMPNMNNDPFFEFPRILTSVLHPLGLINIEDLIVSPVAIYFE